MKIQELAIIFIIIILPISLVLSVYTQFQIQTLNLQTVYDQKLTSATYDAIKAFQLNTANNTESDVATSKIRDIEASIKTFKNSMMSTFGLNGYDEKDLDNYIPALVYTLYDGFYIYSPYENTNYLYEPEIDADGNVKKDTYGNIQYTNTEAYGNGETQYGLKPYMTYSCRYITENIDVVITYALDNYITIQGMINDKYVNDSGYLIDGITDKNYEDGELTSLNYNGVGITAETNLKEYVSDSNRKVNELPYIKINGTKYYYYKGQDGLEDTEDDLICWVLNGYLQPQGQYKGEKAKAFYDKYIANNKLALCYYADAADFTYRVFEEYNLDNLTFQNAYDETIAKDGTTSITQIWPDDTRKIFESSSYPSGGSVNVNIENKSSNFNQHRLEVIRHKIETNLSIAISNYNNYSYATDQNFAMPELKETEWDYVMNNISLISFVQGLPIGGKIYNGYTIVTNSESKEVVLEENIYILGKTAENGSRYYYRIGDKYLNYDNIETGKPAGRINLDFKRRSIVTTSATVYYYPLKDYNASYTSIITQDDVETYEDIYAYVNNSNDALKKAFYMALGRERQALYKTSRNYNSLYNSIYGSITIDDVGITEDGSSETGGGG